MEVVASAPGKVLIAGGYLVLERPNAGLVLSTTARFYAIVRPLRDSLPADSWAWGWTDVKVTSLQLSRVATYKLSITKSTLQLTSARESTNPFVEQAIQFSVAAAKATIIDKERRDVVDKLLLQGLHVTILGCNDFYSYRKEIEARGLPLTPEVLLSLPPFSSITFNSEVANGTTTGEKCKPEVAKTGLGSSAAMTTSVVAAVLHYLGAVNLSCTGQSSGDNATGRGLDLVHAIAQSAHCIAQGKIGSGFDVSAAVYGSQRYVRFSPEILSSAQAIGGTSLPDVVSDILTQKWDQENKQFSLPPLMTLLLGEPGTGGSSTPSMVGSVKRWQKSDPEKSKDTWSKLAIANSVLENQLRILKELSENHGEAYESVVRSCSHLTYGKWTEVATNQDQELIVRSLLAARDASLEIRLHMREMGIATGVPIEPDSQTQLLDATMNMEGVLLAGVPGAGGFDAVFSVTLGDANNAVANAWSSAGVLPLLVREDCRGVSLEDAEPCALVVADRRSEDSMAEVVAQEQPRPMAPRPVRCIVKLGGAAITNKGELESINEENLRSACAQLRHAMSESDGDGATEKVLGMDWSRKPGDPADPAVDAEWIAGMAGLGLNTNFIVVHGAGSFGHFQASRSGVHKGGLHSTLVKAGFVATRISVTSLNQEIVRALAREGIPSVGMSPFACGWSTQQRKLASANASQIIQSLHAGFVPVLHGDAVLDELLDCTILSGDVIIRHLAQLLSPKYVVFLTDVHGVYDRPPTDPNAVLLREIEVDDNGGWSIVKPALLQGNTKGVEISVAAHDTTGGMETKILEAAVIARLGIDVYITKAGTEHSLRALKGDVGTDSEDWLGTIIRSSK